MGLACAFTIDVTIDSEQAYQEGYLFARILRDLHFIDFARSILKVLRRYVRHFEMDRRHDQRLTTLDLGLRIAAVNRRSSYTIDQLRELTRDAEKHFIDLEQEHEDVAPAVSLLAHCVYLFTLNQWIPDSNAVATLKRALPEIAPSLAALIQTVSSSEPDPKQLLTLVKALETARNPEDIAFDLAHVMTAARRFLNKDVAKSDLTSLIFAIELVADHAMRNSGVGTVDSPFASLEMTAKHAIKISQSGLRIVFLGRSESRYLIRVNVENGVITEAVTENESTFSITKFETWTQRFPYGYGLYNDPMNLFYTSTDGLGLSMPGGPPILFVMDNSLQQLPPNLIRLGDEFLGRCTAAASVPSLSWLWQAQKRAPQAAPRHAWISIETVEGKNPTLTMIADRLAECLQEYKIKLDTAPHIPQKLNDSELVIVAAHGRLLPEGRFIQRLSDDASLAVYPAALARAVSGSGIVILFVCSGGRVDSHPTGETTIGLVKDLLNQGCSTVIASPWPLSVGVPPHWLPVFLREWTAGKSPIEATLLANKNVEKALGNSPLDCLAMNVFGDPLRLVSKS